MVFEVWHMRNDNSIHIANVQARSLSHAFELTNNIDSPWDENPEVTVLIPELCGRSTSVGDFFKSQASGASWRVDSVGFSEIK